MISWQKSFYSLTRASDGISSQCEHPKKLMRRPYIGWHYMSTVTAKIFMTMREIEELNYSLTPWRVRGDQFQVDVTLLLFLSSVLCEIRYLYFRSSFPYLTRNDTSLGRVLFQYGNIHFHMWITCSAGLMDSWTLLCPFYFSWKHRAFRACMWITYHESYDRWFVRRVIWAPNKSIIILRWLNDA